MSPTFRLGAYFRSLIACCADDADYCASKVGDDFFQQLVQRPPGSTFCAFAGEQPRGGSADAAARSSGGEDDFVFNVRFYGRMDEHFGWLLTE
jgi:hypothetical protein